MTDFKSKMCALISFHKSVPFPLTNADSMNATNDLILLLCKGVPVVWYEGSSEKGREFCSTAVLNV